MDLTEITQLPTLLTSLEWIVSSHEWMLSGNVEWVLFLGIEDWMLRYSYHLNYPQQGYPK